MWLHLAQTFLHVSMVAGCRRENAWVWMTIDLMTLAMLWLVRSPGPLSTRGCGNKMFVFCFLVRRRGHWHRTAEYEQCTHTCRITEHQTSVRHNIEWYSGPGHLIVARVSVIEIKNTRSLAVWCEVMWPSWRHYELRLVWSQDLGYSCLTSAQLSPAKNP